MSKFNELLTVLGASEGAYPDTMLDDLMGAYDYDMSIPSAKIEELNAANAELNSQIAALKSHNYDLLMAASAAPSGDASDDADDETDDEESDVSIDDLFDDGDN